MSEGTFDDAGIRTPDERLRVFVSAALGELAQEREAVSRAVSALRLTPVLVESGARPHAPRELYRAYLAQSDIFIGVYWQGYGWIGPGMEISGLEDEFDVSRGLPHLLYVKEPAPAASLASQRCSTASRPRAPTRTGASARAASWVAWRETISPCC